MTSDLSLPASNLLLIGLTDLGTPENGCNTGHFYGQAAACGIPTQITFLSLRCFRGLISTRTVAHAYYTHSNVLDCIDIFPYIYYKNQPINVKVNIPCFTKIMFVTPRLTRGKPQIHVGVVVAWGCNQQYIMISIFWFLVKHVVPRLFFMWI